MPSCHHVLPFGAELRATGDTRFRLWAPDAKSVALVLPERANVVPFEADESGWFSSIVPVGVGTRYLFRIDAEIDVPDPAARFTPEGLTGPAEVIDPSSFDWNDRGWRGLPWHQTVLYELHVGTFTTEGTFAAIIPRLPDLVSLGINTIELLPIATFPGRRGWGYDGVLPFAPHPAYGRPDDLKQLIQAAHAHQIAVVLDVVYNHFGPEGNYLHRYARGFFTERYRTPWGAAIDFESAASRSVRNFFIQNALYWLNEYRFDGLRLDAIHAIRDSSDPHFVDELAAAIERGPGRDRYIHLILENHDNEVRRLRPSVQPHVAKAQWNDDFHHVLHVLLTGERDGYYAQYADRTAERLGRVLAEGFAYQGEPYGPQREPRGEASASMPVTAFIDFLQNHDQIGNRAFGERIAALATLERLRAAFAILLLAPQVPMLFMGEEYAARQPFLYFCDYSGELAEAITAGRRNEFAAFGTFGDATARERIPDPNALATFEASRLHWYERMQEPHCDWLEFVKGLLKVRAEHIVPRVPNLIPGSGRYWIDGSIVSVRWSSSTGEELGLDANLGGESCVASARPAEHLLHSTSQARADRLLERIHAPFGLRAQQRLAPWEVRLTIVPV